MDKGAIKTYLGFIRMAGDRLCFSCTHMIVFVLGVFDSFHIDNFMSTDLSVFTPGCSYGTCSCCPARGS